MFLKAQQFLLPSKSEQVVRLLLIFTILIILLFGTVLPNDMSGNESSDYTRFYEPVAWRLLTGHGFVWEDGLLATTYPPGYPILLAFLFSTATWLHITPGLILVGFTILSLWFSSICLYFLAQNLWSTRLAILTGITWLTYPFALWITKQPNSEIPFSGCISWCCCPLFLSFTR